ncbi:hypothetical protein I553_7715 [Mycobacterium xenopi 4042]|uniref:Uncharacterized protein n=1 Tax=Mycobacterium xenopi 4042 TaxID=1299334 RepID=X8ARA4_MYCXE|nr:hypothetical protein I553_7715 [Mycobacterium xenopi 4042]
MRPEFRRLRAHRHRWGHRSGRFLLPDPESADDGGERVAPSALQRRGGPRRHVTGKCWVMTRAISM